MIPGALSAHKTIAIALALLIGMAPGTANADNFILLQSTTSTENSGLFEHLLPQFRADTGIEVRVVAVGTGQALRNAARGDGDVVLVHSRSDEEAFVSAGFGVERFDVMSNEYVIIGPGNDPAGLRDATDAKTAFEKIAGAAATFVSRGDDSGTHKAEQRLWRASDYTLPTSTDHWYRETGAGMGATLNIAVAMSAYTLSDRASWLAFGAKAGHRIVFEGDTELFNQYGIILVNPRRHPHIRALEAQRFINWMLSERGQTAIGTFEINGEQPFRPNDG